MPAVPRYPTGRVENAPVPGFRSGAFANADSFGGAQAEVLGNVAAGMGKAGYMLSNRAVEEQDQLNKSLVREALNQAKIQTRDYLTSDVYLRQGSNAINVVPEAQKKFGQIRDGLLKNLQNDAQKEMFRQLYTDLETDHIGSVMTFQMRERKQYEHQTISAENQNAVEDAVLNRSNPEAIKKAEETIAFNTAYQHRGFGPEVRKTEATKGLSVLHSKILEATMMESARAGLAYLEKNKSKFLPTDYLKYRKTLEHEVMSEAANEMAISLASQPDMTADKARFVIDEQVKDEKQAALVMSGVKARLAEKEAAMTLQQKQFVESSWKSFIENPSQEIPKALPADEQIKMQEYREKAAKRTIGQSQEDSYGKLLSFPANEFVNLNLFEHRAELSQHDFNYLFKLQEKMRKGGDQETDNFKEGLRLAKDQMNLMTYFDTSKERVEAEADRLRNERRQQEFLAVFSRRLQKLPDNQRNDYKKVQELVSELLTNVVLNNTDNDWIPFNEKKAKQFEIEAGSASVRTYASVAEVQADFKAGKLTREQARSELMKLGYKP